MQELTIEQRINQKIYLLSQFLNSYSQTPEEGPLTGNQQQQITRLIQLTSDHGTTDQNTLLYWLLLSTRSVLLGTDQEALRQPIATLTTLFKQLQPNIASDIEITIENLAANTYSTNA